MLRGPWHKTGKPDLPDHLWLSARPPDPGDRIMDFPHAETETFGGCLVSFDQPEEVTQVVCPACVEAKEAWLKSLELD
ncbi:MAG: hypothetical protein UZ17_ACD001000400 [Acidobacteria bacterium OLB17]|nr:MAG: hypothetical protein UZ17_ACD001000400 [Acidobacteria bacterium OLB17]